jgi:DNA-binding transcriptional MerR regulator
MALKMKELIAESGESKSTILYYVKEGLLPEPSKPKPNVHLYDERCVEILRFIKYLQHNFNYSIAEIKKIFANNRFDFDGSFEAMVHSLELISGGRASQWFDRESFLEITGLDEQKLALYENEGLIFSRAQGYSSKEIEIAEILQRAAQLGLDFALLRSYVEAARHLAAMENEKGAQLLEDESVPHDARYALLFDLILTLKPYIFNMHTVQAHHQHVAKETK